MTYIVLQTIPASVGQDRLRRFEFRFSVSDSDFTYFTHVTKFPRRIKTNEIRFHSLLYMCTVFTSAICDSLFLGSIVSFPSAKKVKGSFAKKETIKRLSRDYRKEISESGRFYVCGSLKQGVSVFDERSAPEKVLCSSANRS